tara:strand:- start:1 stop:366 length:366 start_codon:yes stop_codon:yes gene_type:complete
MGRKKITTNFYEDEFECNCGCGLKNINPVLVERLQEARTDYDSPMVVTSGLRCKNFNSKQNGSPNSSHLWGEAVDVAMNDPILRYRMVQIFQKYFKRIGIAKNFIHVDVDHMKIHPCIWTY